jgi:hypothetical protein
MFYEKVEAHYKILASDKVNDLQYTYKAMITVDEDIMEWSVKDIIEFGKVIADRIINLSEKDAKRIYNAMREKPALSTKGILDELSDEFIN